MFVKPSSQLVLKENHTLVQLSIYKNLKSTTELPNEYFLMNGRVLDKHLNGFLSKSFDVMLQLAVVGKLTAAILWMELILLILIL